MPEKPLIDSSENSASSENEDGLLEDRLNANGSMRRSILKSLLALGILPFAKYGETKEKTESILPEGIHIDSMEDLELLVEALEAAIQEDFTEQDRKTKQLRKKTGDLEVKAAPVNGETFMASIEDLAERIEQMINPRGVMERMDRTIDNRFKQAVERSLANPASKEAVKEDVRANLLIDLFATKPIVYRLDDFWERIDEFDASVGKKSNRVPATPKTHSARADDRKIVEYLIKITKGYEAVDEFIEKFHEKNPVKYGDLAGRLSADVGKPFLFDHKVGSMVSLRD